MNLRLGYVALPKTINITSSHTITYTNYEKDENKEKRLYEIIEKNLNNLEQILIYNIKNNIHFYRMSSAIFPLATHPKVNYDIKIFKEKLEKIGNLIKNNNMRVDIHLDQFCVLNSANKDVVNSTINIIKFYKNMLDTMKLKTYMIMHVGSNAFGKQNSITRFINNFNKLDNETKNMIILENDDKIFNIKDVLYICKKINIPMVLDYHHHKCNNDNIKLEEYIEEIFNTWKTTPKVHLSSPKNKKEFRTHNDYINIDDFIEFESIIKNINRDVDIMIEAKEKDNALFKLVRELKYKGYKFKDETTICVKFDKSKKK
ncbi:MAG: UV DNA damage repair endonuclease UvsE [Bacilli bacterium]